MSRSSDRAAVEPLAALVAVFAVSVGLTLYAGVLDDAVETTEPNRAPATADAVSERLTTVGVADPGRVDDSLDAAPSGHTVNVTLVADQRWAAGPSPPPTADTGVRPVSVRVAPGDVAGGQLRVSVW